MNLQEAIDRERWSKNGNVICRRGRAVRVVGEEELEAHNDSLDRIGEAAKREYFSYADATLEELFKKECPVIGNAEYKSTHKESLDRLFISVGKYIMSVVRQYKESNCEPRVMKRWTDDCKPKNPGIYWVRDINKVIYCDYVSIHMINDFGKTLVTHWLELGETPVLPESDK